MGNNTHRTVQIVVRISYNYSPVQLNCKNQTQNENLMSSKHFKPNTKQQKKFACKAIDVCKMYRDRIKIWWNFMCRSIFHSNEFCFSLGISNWKWFFYGYSSLWRILYLFSFANLYYKLQTAHKYECVQFSLKSISTSRESRVESDRVESKRHEYKWDRFLCISSSVTRSNSCMKLMSNLHGWQYLHTHFNSENTEA